MTIDEINNHKLRRLTTFGLLLYSFILITMSAFFAVFTTMPHYYYMAIILLGAVPSLIIAYLNYRNKKYFNLSKNYWCYSIILFFSTVAVFAGGIRSISLTVLYVVPIIAFALKINIIIPSLIVCLNFSILTLFWAVPGLDKLLMQLNQFAPDALIDPNPTYIINYLGVFFGIFVFTNHFDRKDNEYRKTIKQINQELLEAKNSQEQFFINFTHETRTPLTLLKNAYDSVTQQYDLTCNNSKIVKQSIDKLLNDINNFLDRKKLTAGVMVYDHSQVFCLSDLLQLECDLFQGLAENKGVDIKSEIEQGIKIKAAYSAIDRVITNILDNAVSYTDRDGRINIILNKKDNQVNMIISDTGRGIEEEDLIHLYDSFYHAGKKKKNSTGLGQGLSMSKVIIDQIEGAKIKAESQPGEGTIFTLTFPFASEPAEVTPSVIQEKRSFTCMPEDSRRVPGKKNILIVEDEMKMLDYFTSVLSEYNLFFASNGQEALDKLDSISLPDLIISDIMMDKIDGYEFKKILMENDKYIDIPFIFLTAKAQESEKEAGLSLGAIEYMTKPFSITELKSKIHNQLAIMERLKKKAEGITEADIELFGADKGLTKREKEILYHSFQGWPEKKIANELCISLSTVKNHKSKIFEKTEVRSIKAVAKLIEGEGS